MLSRDGNQSNINISADSVIAKIPKSDLLSTNTRNAPIPLVNHDSNTTQAV
jgi:hypothetical protein